MLTDNRVLVENLRPLPALMCIQRKATKTIPTEENLVAANIGSFGNEIGKITNRVTSMFEVQAAYPKDSPEYQELDYRIKCGQHFQQCSIDKAKGIIAKPMPKEWYDRHSIAKIEDAETREFYRRIVADRKPYFMRIIYPTLMRQYNTYIKSADKSALREFRMTVAELQAMPVGERTDRQNEFLDYYELTMPVGMNDCVMNRICRRIEEEFSNYLSHHNQSITFDYTIMKSGIEYSKAQYNQIQRVYEAYMQRLRSFKVYTSYEHVDEYEMMAAMQEMREWFTEECTKICTDRIALCDIILDICYGKAATKKFAWDICASEIICNLLNNNNKLISYPTADPDGDIHFNGLRFSVVSKEVA